MGWGIMKRGDGRQELAPDLKRKVEARRKESAEWDKLYGKTTVEEQYQRALQRDDAKKV
ncbi:hypothetical protein VP01_165g6 [Puccinia sorghi]|uniref:Uncharacterized protein n=1 Tax=Puccinia sorghi TaxID=27349 RepID=A0A0L6VGE4_9BASI|nr:hypothetical protein VP01_165g6 [Puccinia sorghi]